MEKWVEGFLLCLLATGLLFVGRLEIWADQKPAVAILPFFLERGEDPARGATCQICKSVYQSGNIVPGSQNTLTRLLYQKMEALGTFRIIPLEVVEKTLSPSMKSQFEQKPIATAIRIGKELNADFISVDYLFRFEERVGSSLGIEKPASVGFDLHLFRVKDGMEIWKGKFDETQKPLSDDLLKIGSFLRRKATWVTAEELASDGMGEMLKKLPDPKELEERR
jgi:hypothetical protein